jgi:hypothetical protein
MLWLGIGSVRADELPVLQVNSTADAVGEPLMATDGAGNIAVVWARSVPRPSGGYQSAISARLFAADGVPLGEPFLVSDPATEFAASPSLAMDASGAFVVSWIRGLGTPEALVVQRFAAGGFAQGAPIVVKPLNAQSVDAKVVMGPDHSFVVGWHEIVFKQTGSPRSGSSTIYARRYEGQGVPATSELTVNVTRVESRGVGDIYVLTPPAIAVQPDGSFTVAWRQEMRYLRVDLSSAVYAQRYSSTGEPLSHDSRVSHSVSYTGNHPVAASDAGGNYVIAWGGMHQVDADSYSGYDLLLRRYAAGGTALGEAQQINNELLIFLPAALSMNASGEFVTAWVGTASSFCCIPAHVTYRRFAPDGTAVGEPVTVSDDYPQSPVAASIDNGGNIAVSWNIGGVIKMRLYHH